jgi:hypothetical protein
MEELQKRNYEEEKKIKEKKNETQKIVKKN